MTTEQIAAVETDAQDKEVIDRDVEITQPVEAEAQTEVQAEAEAKTDEADDVPALKAEVKKLRNDIAKFREYEKEFKATQEGKDYLKYKKEFEKAQKERDAAQAQVQAFVQKERDGVTASALENTLTENRVIGTLKGTALALVDKSKIEYDGNNPIAASVEAEITRIKAEHPGLFRSDEKQPVAASVARASDGDVVSGYTTELAAARKTGKQAEINKVLKKYNMI